MKPHQHTAVTVGRSSQRGMILITGLLLLVLVTLVVLAASRGGRLQSIMAFNTRDRDLAFQAAEAALLDGEERVIVFHDSFQDPANSESTNPAPGMLNRYVLTRAEKTRLIVLGSTSDYWVRPAGTDGYGWFNSSGAVDTSKSIASSKTVAGVDTQPRFVVEYLDSLAPPGECGGHAHHRYRITALAIGASKETRVILQSEYRHCAS